MKRTTYIRPASMLGFFHNPVVVGALVAIIICCAIAGGLILVRFAGVS